MIVVFAFSVEKSGIMLYKYFFNFL